MFTNSAVPDIERQHAQEASAGKEHNGVRQHREPTGVPPLDINYLKSGAKMAFEDRVGQSCFLCLKGKTSGHYAYQIPCLRPTKFRRITGHRMTQRVLANGGLTFVNTPGGERYERRDPKGSACESDSAIYERLRKVCFHHHGQWKEWLPFYGIVDVEEVTFHFLGVVEPDGRFPIRMTPVNLGEVRDETDRTIELQSGLMELEEICWDTHHHGYTCRMSMEYQYERCIKVRIDEAIRRKDRLAVLHWLRDSARDPRRANGLETLKGMASASPILNLSGTDRVSVPQYQQPYDHVCELRGLHFEVGWDFELMARKLPLGATWIVFGLALTWSCVIIWAGPKGDWSTAMAFGQLIATCLSLVFLYARD